MVHYDAKNPRKGNDSPVFISERTTYFKLKLLRYLLFLLCRLQKAFAQLNIYAF